jgi:hypothetical protein
MQQGEVAIPDRPRNQYGDEMCITEMCMELHFDRPETDHLGRPDPARRAELIGFLEYKLASWQWPQGQPYPNQFDDAVQSLILAALAESRAAARSVEV